MDSRKPGASADEVVTLLNGMIKRARIYFLVDTLEYLQRGGRIGGAARWSVACCRSSPF